MDKWLNKIICGDNVEVMRQMPDRCIDLTVTSPPYDNLRDYFLDKFVVWRYNLDENEKSKIIEELIRYGVKPVATSK